MFKVPTIFLTIVLYVLFPFSVHSTAYEEQSISFIVNQYLQAVADPIEGIGAREAGSAKEQQTIAFVEKEFKKMGLTVNVRPFELPKKTLSSANVIADLNNNQKQTLILGAHLDSTGEKHGSQGATDNASGLAAMLTIAGKLASTKNLPYNLRFIAFGAEEVGLVGSKHYVNELLKETGSLDNIIAMINLDTIAGGDYLYVHSAHTTPYKCDNTSAAYNSDTHIRDRLFNISKQEVAQQQQYIIHPAYEGYPEGVTGQWSDHAPFACAGVPIAYIESTNFTLNGKDGYDGYSQTDNPALWDCFDKETGSACDRKKEKQWGDIWHTHFDQLATLNPIFPQRITQQLTANVKVLIAFFSNFKLEDNTIRE